MTLAIFNSKFPITADAGNSEKAITVDCGDPGLSEIITALGGKTFCHGLYRVLRSDQILEATEAMEGVFPEFKKRIVPFGYDWLGRHFAVDLGRIEHGIPQVLRLEAGTGEAMSIPTSIEDLHNIEFAKHSDDALSAPFWKLWWEKNPKPLAYSECVGYKVPLFLGGADELSNLEIIELSVYVHICGQLRNKVLSLSAGQKIGRISMTE